MIINIEGYDLTGTPAEILELLDLLASEVNAVEAVPNPEPPAPAPKTKPAAKTKKIDWNKARALRDAGWSYAKIGDELGVSDVTVSAHLRHI